MAGFEGAPTGQTLREYFLGEWLITKTMNYDRGGITGSFTGSAAFAPLEYAERTLVTFAEQGKFVASDQRVFDTRNRLLYDFSDEALTRVYFDESLDDRSASAVVASGVVLVVHLCS